MSIEQYQTPAGVDLSDQMRYAETVSRANLLPAAYRGKPADILIATGLGNAIGIAPAQALYEIYVVNGRPSPSANLMAALVRRAGHKLRIQGDDRTCTATLVRADDPDFPMSATWTIEKAQAAKLTGKDTWKQFPGAMLRARAIAEVVRMGAPEAVMGMEYAREEVEQFHDGPTPSAGGLGAALRQETVTAEQITDPSPAPDAATSEPDAPPAASLPADAGDVEASAGEALLDTRSSLARRMFAAMRDAGIDDKEDRLAVCSEVAGRTIATSAELTEAEAEAVIREVAGS